MFNTLQEYLIQQTAPVSVLFFSINLFITAVLGYLLGLIYIKFGNTFSNRTKFSNNFLIISMTTMIIITIVKTSLALSLGLVGALSIVRFRAAIKEPEELTYLFISIAVGLGLGANQTKITIVGFIAVCLVIFLKNLLSPSSNIGNMILNISLAKTENIDVENIIKILKSYCKKINLRRIDETEKLVEASFIIEVVDYQSVVNIQKKLKSSIDKKINISFLDNKGIV